MIKPDLDQILAAMSSGTDDATAIRDPRTLAIMDFMEGQGNMSRMPHIDPGTIGINRQMNTLYPTQDNYLDDPEYEDRPTSPEEEALIRYDQMDPNLEGTDTHVRHLRNTVQQPNMTDPNEPPMRMDEGQTQDVLDQILSQTPLPRRDPRRRR